MQVQRKANTETRVVTLTVTGDLFDADLLTLADELQNAPEVESDFSLLIDLRHAKGRNVTSAGVRNLVERPMVLSAESRRAVVVSSDLGFGMARMYEILRDRRGGAIRVFRDYEDAERWVETGVL